MKKFFNLQKFKDAMSITSSVLTVLAMVFSIFTLQYILLDSFDNIKIFMMLSFFSLAIAMIPLVIKSKKGDKSTLLFVKFLTFAITYTVLGVLAISLPYTALGMCIICMVYLATVIANRACKIFEVEKTAIKIFNGLLAVGTTVLLALVITSAIQQKYDSGLLLTALIMFIVALVGVLAYAFSKIRLNAMIKIIRRTYVLEVLYGLVVLIISFSFIFYIFEGIFPTYGDALWYSFAVITTIGFGDFAAVSVVGRILSVILGLYGIIVVAIITSVVVNFYNETKNKDNDDKKDKNDEKE